MDDLVRIFTKAEVIQYISGGKPLSQSKCSELSQNWCDQWNKYGYGPWAALNKESGQWIGEVGLELLDDWPQQDKWEVGWILDSEFWGKGLATEDPRPTASANASTRPYCRSSTRSPFARKSTTHLTNYRPTWILGCSNTMRHARTVASTASARLRCKRSWAACRWQKKRC